MNGKAQFGVGLLLIALLVIASAPFDNRSVRAQDTIQVPTVIDVTNPASGLITVDISYPAALLPDDYLYLSFPILEDHPNALKSITAGEELTLESMPGITRRIDLSGYDGDLHVQYTLDPLYFPPQYSHDEPLNAAARLTADLGVLRTSDILPYRTEWDGGFIYQTAFLLPEGWQAITPWPLAVDGSVPIPAESVMQTEYLAVGPFATETVTLDTTQVLIATLDEAALPATTIIEILMHIRDLFESAPQAASLAVSIIPDDFLYGGSAGTLTINSNADPHFVAHEMVHWWNTLDLTAGEATAWFREGFTDYYSLRIMHDMGIWTDEYMAAGWSRYEEAVAQMEEDPPLGLAEISEQQQQNENYAALVYVKGALVARLIDTTLQAEDRSLDEAMRAIFNSEQRGLSNADLQQIFHDVYSGLVDDLFERYVISGANLP